MKRLKVKNHKEFAAFDYESSKQSTAAELGDVLMKDNEIGVIIQIHPDHDFRTDMWGNCSPGECCIATVEDVRQFRPAILYQLAI